MIQMKTKKVKNRGKKSFKKDEKSFSCSFLVTKILRKGDL